MVHWAGTLGQAVGLLGRVVVAGQGVVGVVCGGVCATGCCVGLQCSLSVVARLRHASYRRHIGRGLFGEVVGSGVNCLYLGVGMMIGGGVVVVVDEGVVGDGVVVVVEVAVVVVVTRLRHAPYRHHIGRGLYGEVVGVGVNRLRLGMGVGVSGAAAGDVVVRVVFGVVERGGVGRIVLNMSSLCFLGMKSVGGFKLALFGECIWL